MQLPIATAFLLALCLATSVSMAMGSIFLPQFHPDADINSASGRILLPTAAAEANSSNNVDFVWFAGSTDRVAYVDRCQPVVVRIAPRFLPMPMGYYWANNLLTIEFTCSLQSRSGSRKLVTRIFPNSFDNSTGEAFAHVNACNETGSELRVVKRSDSDVVIAPNCSFPYGSIRQAAINESSAISVRVLLNLSEPMSSGTIFDVPRHRIDKKIESKRLTLVYLDKVVEVSQIADMPLIEKGFVTSISNLVSQWAAKTPSDEFLVLPFLNIHALNFRNSLPVFLRSTLRTGAVLTTAESCKTFNDTNSVRIVTNHILLSNASSSDFPEQFAHVVTLTCGDANFFHIDERTGELLLSPAGLQVTLAPLLQHTSGGSLAKLRLCETLQFVGHSFVNKQVAALDLPVFPTFVHPSSNACMAAYNFGVSGSSVELLNSGSPATAVPCPLVCATPRSISCDLNAQLNASGLSNFTCHAESSATSAVVSVRTTHAPRFLADNASLPLIVFATEGEPLSYSCSAVVSVAATEASQFPNSTSATISAFIRVPYWSRISKPFRIRRWSQIHTVSWDERPIVKPLFDSIEITRARQTTFTGAIVETLTATVQQVPPATDAGNFTHHFACQLVTDSETASRLFGTHEALTSTVGTDVIFVPRPTDESFSTSFVNETTVRYEIFQLYVDYLGAVGARIVGGFRLGSDWLTDQHPLVSLRFLTVEFQNSTGALLLTVGKRWPAGHPKLPRLELTAVFSFRYPDRDDSPITDAADQLSNSSAEQCRADPRCFYSTDFDSELLQVLRLVLDVDPPGAVLENDRR